MKLPKFSKELIIYEEGDVVENPFSGESIELNATELAIYDYIMGLQWVIDRMGAFNEASFPHQKELRKGLDWFRTNNAKAYMVLLD
jgi:hypothetical protein